MTGETEARETEETWHSVLVAFESTHPGAARAHHVFEVRAMLVRATNDDDARKKAEQLGLDGEQEYTNVHGERVAWRFKEILDVCCLSWVSDFSDGTEVYYHYLDSEGLAELRRTLRRKIADDGTPASESRGQLS